MIWKENKKNRKMFIVTDLVSLTNVLGAQKNCLIETVVLGA